jgi:C-terminal processing protease CtpA/Prc
MFGKIRKEKIKNYLMTLNFKIVLKWFLVFAVIFSFGAFASYFYYAGKMQERLTISIFPEPEEKNVYIEFVSEIYDKIQKAYWDNLTDFQLVLFFKAASERLMGTQYALKSNDKEGLRKILEEIMNNLNEAQKKEFTVKAVSLVLANLQPLGRSGLYTRQDEESLKNSVYNVDPGKDLYKDLGISKGASEEEIKRAYSEKVVELEKKKDSPEIQKELEKVQYAYEVLSDEQNKERYDGGRAEPTVFYKLARPDIFHIYIKRFSPTTFDEFLKAVNSLGDKKGVSVLILDLRGNIGGSIDILQYFLGPFIGQDQYAYEFLHKGERKSFKTLSGWHPALVRYKQVVILADGQTQSTAELMAATLKKYNVGIIVGAKTRGWGTIEAIFEIKQQIDPKEKFSVFLVHSLALRDDNLPLEGNGVDPVIDINSPNWEKQLFEYFRYPELAKAIKEIWNESPAKF